MSRFPETLRRARTPVVVVVPARATIANSRATYPSSASVPSPDVRIGADADASTVVQLDKRAASKRFGGGPGEREEVLGNQLLPVIIPASVAIILQAPCPAVSTVCSDGNLDPKVSRCVPRPMHPTAKNSASRVVRLPATPAMSLTGQLRPVRRTADCGARRTESVSARLPTVCGDSLAGNIGPSRLADAMTVAIASRLAAAACLRL